MRIKYRDAKEEDLLFLYQLNILILKEYIEKTWGWDEAWQSNYFKTHFNLKLIKVIVFSNNDIGCLRLEEGEKELTIL